MPSYLARLAVKLVLLVVQKADKLVFHLLFGFAVSETGLHLQLLWLFFLPESLHRILNARYLRCIQMKITGKHFQQFTHFPCCALVAAPKSFFERYP